MKVASFAYHDPTTIPEVLDLLDRLEDHRLLAGGQSLVPYLAFRMQRCRHLIDLNRVDALAGIVERDGRLRIGAMTRQRTLANSPLVASHAPVAQEALKLIGHIATRTRGTLGGSLCNLDPSAELLGVSALHDAVLHVESRQGARDVAIGGWAEDFMKPVLAPGEMLRAISWEPWPAGHGHAILEFSKRHHDYAIVAAGALIAVDADRRITRAAVVVMGCSIAPVRLTSAEAMLKGRKGSVPLFAEAAAEVAKIDPFPDEFAHQGYPRRFVSSQFRHQLGLVLVRRALAQGYARATPHPDGN